MGLLNSITNGIKAAVGYQQDFESLLESKDVSRALNYMRNHGETAAINLLNYDVETHEVMKRKDKAVYDKKGNFIRWSKRWKLPIPYQVFINEIALVFLYGRPVKWSQKSDNTDDVYAVFKETLEEIRFDANVREAKRKAGAEGVSAILYHVHRNDENKPELKLNVLSKSNHDDIYTLKDQYKKLKAFGWGYTMTESGGRSVHHVDIYTSKNIFMCKRGNVGWEVNILENQIGKIPVILFEQEVESAGVQYLIDRVEYNTSVDADVNDRFANPAMVADAEILNSLPKQEEEAKLYIMKNGGSVKYLTWDQASESKKNEHERLDKHILNKTFTPQIDFDNMKGLSNVSAKALKQMMILAVIKAEKRKETHDAYMSRAANLLIAILGNILDYKNQSKYNSLIVKHEFQEPFGDDVSDHLNDLIRQYESGALSLETLLEQSYLVTNAQQELDRIKEEQLEALERQRKLNTIDVFETAE